LDLGCGTGLVGKALWEAGFRNITGVDISESMMERARQSNYYEKCI
jgi:predicted TPR repeat methyltransferase